MLDEEVLEGKIFRHFAIDIAAAMAGISVGDRCTQCRVTGEVLWLGD